MQETEVYQHLEKLTHKLHRLVDEKKGNLLDPCVVAVSQEMDRLIVFIQRNRMTALEFKVPR